MSSAAPTTPLRTVLLAAIEPSEAGDQVIRTASALARIVPGAELHLLYVVVPGPPMSDLAVPLKDLVHYARSYLERAVSEASEQSETEVAAHLAIGAPVAQILQVAADLSADLIIVGTHGKKHIERALGSVSQKVLAGASCAVLVARPKEEHPDAPEIEPPCPECVEVQRATHGETLWCREHAKRHVRGHLHYSIAPGFGAGSMFIRP